MASPCIATSAGPQVHRMGAGQALRGQRTARCKSMSMVSSVASPFRSADSASCARSLAMALRCSGVRCRVTHMASAPTDDTMALAVAALAGNFSFMGRSFLVGLCESAHRTGQDRPAHFPRPTGHALPCSAYNRPPCAAGLDTTRHLHNLAPRGQVGVRGLRGFSITHTPGRRAA